MEQTPERELVEETEILVTPGTEEAEVEAVSMKSARGTKEACEDIVIAEAEESRVHVVLSEGVWTKGEDLGIPERSIPVRDIHGEATAMESHHHDLTSALGQEDLTLETADHSAEDLLDDAEISALLELEEESGKSDFGTVDVVDHAHTVSR